jgi:hypothetical protein
MKNQPLQNVFRTVAGSNISTDTINLELAYNIFGTVTGSNFAIVAGSNFGLPLFLIKGGIQSPMRSNGNPTMMENIK